MIVYVASSFNNIPAVRSLMREIEQSGHSISCEWTMKDALSTGLKPGTASYQEFLYDCGKEDFMAILNSDALVFLAHEDSRDSMAEMGIAMGAGKPVFVLDAERRPSVFYGCPGVFKITREELIPKLNKMAMGYSP